MHDIIDNNKNETVADDAAELAIQAGITDGNLREQYDSNRDNSCKHPSYSELIESFKP